MILPPPLMTSEPGSFARSTIVERKPQIIRQVQIDHDYPHEISQGLNRFREEIASHPIQPLSEDAADVSQWNEVLQNTTGKTWLEVPWYFAEAWFYRRLLEIVHYFQPGDWLYQDPFRTQKDRQVILDIDRLSGGWEELFSQADDQAFIALLYSSLWGNRTDLSNFTVKEKAHSGFDARDEAHLMIINHSKTIHRLLSSGVQRVDFINDNVGVDILFDLALADFLLNQQWAEKVVFHLKNQPFFVSDAMSADVLAIISSLRANPLPAISQFGARLDQHIEDGNLMLQEHPFWTSWKMFRQMPPTINHDLSQSQLVFLKGDVNYRRLLDDAHWPYTTAIQDAASYFPAPLAALRTLKGEIIIGLRSCQAEALAKEDPGWLINGKRGIIHYYDPLHSNGEPETFSEGLVQTP
jgi:hypothetical protein